MRMDNSLAVKIERSRFVRFVFACVILSIQSVAINSNIRMFPLCFRWISNKRCLPLRIFTSIVFLFYWLRPEWENAFPDRFIIVIQIRGVYPCQGNRDVNSCPKQVNSSYLTFRAYPLPKRKTWKGNLIKRAGECIFSPLRPVRRNIRECRNVLTRKIEWIL